MNLEDSLKAIREKKEALQKSASNPSYISDHAYQLALYVAIAEDHLDDLEEKLLKLESESFNGHVYDGKSANAAKELVKREFIDERAEVAKLTRIVRSGWRLVNASQSRVKHLIAEANNQI